MRTILEHAKDIAGPLSSSLSVLEAKSTAVPPDIAHRAIQEVWLTVVDDIAANRANVSSKYLAQVHERLAHATHLEKPGSFTDHGLPILPDGNQESWSRFAKDCRFEETDGLEEEYALAQLRWGNHVQTFALSLGWFAMNIVRLRRGNIAIYPPPSDHYRFLGFLKDAGPDDYDAEGGLRGLADKYAEQQLIDGDEVGAG